MNSPDLSWIRPGGKVALEEANNTVTFEFIERLTPTTITVGSGRRFRRSGSFAELASDNGRGVKTNRQGKLAAPTNVGAINRFARQQLRAVAREAGKVLDGAGATIYKMDAAAVRAELNRIQDFLMAARKEIDRHAGL
jgi:hypothetical protein